MPTFTPDSTIILLETPLESDLRSTLWFPDANTQAGYFQGLGGMTLAFDDYNYVKKDSTLVVRREVDQLWRYNYMMYRNSNFTNKWFYAFVNKVEWASNASARVYFTTDPIQTYMFDWTLYTSFIKRQHSTTDVAGDNIQPEPFSVSRTKYQAAGAIDCEPNIIQVFATSTGTGATVPGSKLGGIYSGAGRVSVSDGLPTEVLNIYVENGTATAVSKIQQVSSLGDFDGVNLPTSKLYNYPKHPTNVDGYVPRNNKLLSGAFCSGYAAGFGQKLEFVPEFCVGAGCTIKVIQDLTSGTLYFYVPDDGMTEEGIDNVSTGFSISIPESTWAYNQYKNDYNLHSASNSMNVQRLQTMRQAGAVTSGLNTVSGVLGVADSALNTANSILTFGLAGATDLGGVASNMANAVNSGATLAQYVGGYDSETQALQEISENYNAPAVGGVANSNPFLAGGQWYVKYGWEVPDARFARVYDNFLTVYGYAQNIYAVPNIHARQCWTYIQVSELMCEIGAPQQDIKTIKKAFENGIFFWDYRAQYGNFDQDNGIV